MGLRKVGDKVVNAKTNIGGTITGEVTKVSDNGDGYPYLVRGVFHDTNGTHHRDESIWADEGDVAPPTATLGEGDEFTVMRVCAAWIDGLPTTAEKTRVLTYLEDRFEA